MKKMFAFVLYVFSFCVANALTAATYFPPCQASFGTITNPNQQVLCAGSNNTELILVDDAAFPYTTLYLLVDDDTGIVSAMQPNSIFALADAAAGSYHIYPINLLAEQLPSLYNLVQTSSTQINTLDTILQNNNVCFALDTVGVGIEVLEPLGLFINEECEFDLDYIELVVTFFGGYPQYNQDSVYALNGSLNGEFVYGDTVVQAFADNSTYQIVLTAGGCEEVLMKEDLVVCAMCNNDVGQLNVDTSTICNGVVSVDVIDEEGSILVYVLHNTPPLFATSDTLFNVLAINNSGIFDLNNVPNLIEGATYYLSAVIGDDGDENGVIDDYTDGCTVVSESKQFVYHSPISLLVNTICDTLTQLNNISIEVVGNTPPYSLSGNVYQGTINQAVTINNLPDNYYGVIVTDSYGCSVSSNFIANCGGMPPCQASFGTITNPNQQVLCAGSNNTELVLVDDAAFPYTTLYLLVDDDTGIVRAMQPNPVFALADAAAGSYHIYPINLLAEQLPSLYNLVQTSSTPINTLDTILQNNNVCFALDTVGVGVEVLEPLGWFIDEEVSNSGEVVLIVTFFGGYPQYTPDSTYVLNGTINGEFAYGDMVAILLADNVIYDLILTAGGCEEVLMKEDIVTCTCHNYLGQLNVDTSTICNGVVSVDVIDEEVSILVYVLHNTPPLFTTSDTLFNVLAINSSGVFDLNNVPNLVEGATYYLSAVAGVDENIWNGDGVIDDYTDCCTVVSESKQFVYHSPISLLVNTTCDTLTQLNNISVEVIGNTPPYLLSGNVYQGAVNQAVTINNSPDSYYGVIATDSYGCSASSNFTANCGGMPPCQASFGTITNPNQQVLCAGSNNTELVLADDAAFPYTTLYLLVDDDAGIVRAMQPNSIFALADAAAGSYHIYPINLPTEQLPNLYNLVQTSSTPINTLDTMLQNNSVCFALDTVGVGIEVLEPLQLITDDDCDPQTEGFTLFVTFAGGYPQYNTDSTYVLNGSIDGEVAYGDIVTQSFEDGTNYNLTLTAGGCEESITIQDIVDCGLCYNNVSLLSDVDTSIICNGVVSVDAIDEDVEGAILVYVLHNTPLLFTTPDTLSNVLAINSSGIFDLNNVPNLIEGATYYLSAVIGDDGDENGVIDDYTDACTVVSESKQFVYHTNCDPIGIDTPTHLGALQLQLSPVPAHNVLQITYVATQKSTINAVVYDALGSVLDVFYVVANEGKGTYPLAIDSYASGVYFVRLNDSQYSTVAKFVKE